MNIITINNLRKSYGAVKAVDDVSFCVRRGALFAFLGINGAGKSTTINILASTLTKDDGQVTVDGLDLETQSQLIRERIGIVFQTSVCDLCLTVKENLAVKASLYGLNKAQTAERIGEIAQLLSLGDILSRPYKNLSGGQRRRVDIARGLINKPKLLFLDEPTTGLDPKTRITIWKVIDELRAQDDLTVFLTTHYMEEAENADDVVIIDGGKVVAAGTPHELKLRYSGDYLKIYSAQPTIEQALKQQQREYFYENGYYKVKMNNTNDAKDFIKLNDAILTDFELVKGNMDDVFLRATGKNLGDI